MSGSHLCIRKDITVISETELSCSVSQFLHTYICEKFKYMYKLYRFGIPLLLQEKYVDRSREYINHSEAHECEIGIFVAVCGQGGDATNN
jgi:hypothetical protein